MMKNVVIADDDQSLLLSLKEGLEKYKDTFSVTLAGDGLIAKKAVEKTPISLVVADLKMPKMDGFTLLSFIIENYPEIPVIVMTGYGTPQMEKMAKEGGAISYIEKPFNIEELARNIMTALRMESEGGTLHGISSGMFLQLIEMEQKTCTIRVSEKTKGRQGILFFKDGLLLDARAGSLKDEKAAQEIFSWEEATLSLQNKCPVKEKRIKAELQSILLESARLKDEANEKPKTPAVKPKQEKDSHSFEGNILKRIEKSFASKGMIQDTYKDSTWNNLIAGARKLGEVIDAGDFKACIMDNGKGGDMILLPEEKDATVIYTKSCPREKIVQILTE